jgi:beta-N-acetylhexosaminidase
MTAHVLVPSLDEERPATLSPRIVQALLRDELGFAGVILSDDLEMKAIAKSYAVPDAAVQALSAGCDAVLICSGDVEVQAATLEALVHAVEDGRIPFKRAEDALARNRRAKERFLAAPAAAGLKPAALRQVLGSDEHRRIAEEMQRYL